MKLEFRVTYDTDISKVKKIFKGTSKNAIFAHRRFRIGLTIC